MQIFESVSGKILNGGESDEAKLKIRLQLEKVGCTVISNGENWFEITGTFSQIKDVSELMKNLGKQQVNSDSNTLTNVVEIPMPHRDFKILMYFAKKRSWFKQYWKLISFAEKGLICEVPLENETKFEEDIKKHLDEVKMMTCNEIEAKDDSKEVIQEMEEKYPNVCLILNEKTVEVISDFYEDALKVQTLMTTKKNTRSNRKFAIPDDREEPSPSSTANDVYHPGGDNSQTKSKPSIFEMETTEGLSIKVYVGSITRLSVDCIVNAANEHLMHGGGVAAAISEAAGYQFDQESQKYIADNGPIPVGSCCVTSAGKLSYKHVIHTVGPRWGDYTDKRRCLQDLQQSVMVTFKKADELNMKSIAIPAISSGNAHFVCNIVF